MAKLKKPSPLAAASLLSGLLVSAPAWAQDATWLASPTVMVSPGVFDFNANANWTPATAPGSTTNTATASFGASNGTNISFSSGSTSLGGFTFNAGASNYVFTNNGFLTFNGAGIVVNGGSATFNNTSLGNLIWIKVASVGGCDPPGSPSASSLTFPRFANERTGDQGIRSITMKKTALMIAAAARLYRLGWAIRDEEPIDGCNDDDFRRAAPQLACSPATLVEKSS